jgi:hypothetical protein
LTIHHPFSLNFCAKPKTCVVVTSERILWATLDKRGETAVLAARLSETEVKDFRSDLLEDRGLEIFGSINEFPERATAFIGCGEEEAAQKLRRILMAAAQTAKHK